MSNHQTQTTPPPAGDIALKALAVAGKIVLVIGVTVFVFFGTCVPLGMSLSEKTKDFVGLAILISLVAALTALVAMVHFIFFKKSVIALIIVVVLAVIGLLALFAVMG